jgi:hypothetical protein
MAGKGQWSSRQKTRPTFGFVEVEILREFFPVLLDLNHCLSRHRCEILSPILLRPAAK